MDWGSEGGDLEDIEDLARADDSEVGSRTARRRRGVRYVFAPVSWLLDASSLPNKAGLVAIELAFLRGVTRSAQVKFNPQCLRTRISRFTVYRALNVLRMGGLIELDRKRGKLPLVTLRFPRN
jgi:DNA-binding transcriptional ArsR family regulator